MGNPSTMYVRFWFRWLYRGGTMHNLALTSSTIWGTPFVVLRATATTFSFYANELAGENWYYDGTIDLNTWYRLEYKITGGGGTSGTVLVRLNGTDITSSMRAESDGRYLTAENGGLTVSALNYFSIGTYYGQAVAGEWEHFTGLKITDGPDWIGGDDEEPTPSRKLNNVTGVRVTLH